MKETTVRKRRFCCGLMAAGALALASMPLSAQAGLAEQEGRSMRIGIIGSGAMGGRLVAFGPMQGIRFSTPPATRTN